MNRNTVTTAYKRLVISGLAQSLRRNDTIIKGIIAPVALGSGDPDALPINLSDGNPAPVHLSNLSCYFTKVNKNPRLYDDAAVSPDLRAWAAQRI